MDIIDDYPDQLRVVIDELVSNLNHSQLDNIEDLIVNNYGEEEMDWEGIKTASDVEKCIIDTNGAYAECIDRLVDSMNPTFHMDQAFAKLDEEL
tara:strand:- start:315 stop:596 length:282 start_codon:yes stop_codon:yes gene_type:complete